MSNKKYELIKSDTKEFLGRTLYRVKYLRDSEYFSKGDLGGYIEKEANLSQEGDAWVSGDARVYGDVKVDCVLCSRFSFKNQAQVDKWLELEKQFEEIKDTLKDKPKRLEDLSKKELIEKIKELEEGVEK